MDLKLSGRKIALRPTILSAYAKPFRNTRLGNFHQNCPKAFLKDIYILVRSCNHYALFVIIAQILQNLAFPLFTPIIKTQKQCKLRSTLRKC